MAEKKLMGKKPLPAIVQEQIIQNAQREDKKTKIQRVTVDFPLYLYDLSKAYTDETGQSLKSFIVGQVRDFFDARAEKKLKE
jgi:hypothetical protein